jgi:hypothetical protein
VDPYVTASPPNRPSVSRRTALWRVAAMYLAVQGLSYVILQTSCSSYALVDLWVHGALGPLAAVEAVPRFRYHSFLSNAAFLALSGAILGVPFVYVVWPRRVAMVMSLFGLVVWWLFGLGFTIHHM